MNTKKFMNEKLTTTTTMHNGQPALYCSTINYEFCGIRIDREAFSLKKPSLIFLRTLAYSDMEN